MVKKTNEKYFVICDCCGSISMSNLDRYNEYITGQSKTSLCMSCFDKIFKISSAIDKIKNNEKIYKFG
jgi:hypothetical protein